MKSQVDEHMRSTVPTWLSVIRFLTHIGSCSLLAFSVDEQAGIVCLLESVANVYLRPLSHIVCLQPLFTSV